MENNYYLCNTIKSFTHTTTENYIIMAAQTEFNYSNNGDCQFEIGQSHPEFAPMNFELKFSLNEKSMDIIIGLADPERKYLNESWLHINLFIYRIIPTIILTTGYIQVVGNVIIKNEKNIDLNEWVNGTDDHVNIVVVDDYKDDYVVKEIRKVQLPMMKTIRNVLKEQITRSNAEIENILKIIEDGFQTPWMIHYTDEQCNYVKENPGDIQKGEYIINEPKEKKIHVY